MSLPLNVTEYDRRVKANTELFVETYKYKFDVSSYNGCDMVAGERPPGAMLNKPYDIFAAAAVGCLAYGRKNNGPDGVILVNNVLRNIELKYCCIHSGELGISSRGNVISKSNPKKTLCGLAKGEFKITSDKQLNSKNITTYLVLFDEYTNSFVGAWVMDGETVLQLLTANGKKSDRRSISLGQFIEYGKPVTLMVQSIGLDNFIQMVKDANNWTPKVSKK